MAEGQTCQYVQHLVLKLKKALYGLKQSGRRWYQTFLGIMGEFGFTRCESDHAVFLQKTNNSTCVVIVHIDDLTLTGSSLPTLLQFKRDISGRLEMSDMGELHWLLVLRVWESTCPNLATRPKRCYTDSVSIVDSQYIYHILPCGSIIGLRS